MEESKKKRIDELQTKYRRALLERVKEIDPRITEVVVTLGFSSDPHGEDFRDVEKFKDKFTKGKPLTDQPSTDPDLPE